MLKTTLRMMTAAVAVALGAPFLACAAGPQRPPVAVVAPYVALTADEKADLLYMREEEKLARDIYLKFDETFGSAPFALVAVSEQRHMDAMLKLLLKYGLADPAAGKLAGEFTDPELQALYDGLVAKGLTSELDALLVGGLIEEVDASDLAKAAARTAKVDIDRVYANLACGSRNHLRAFASRVTALTGMPYIAQFLPQPAVDAIVQQPWERCGRS
jgi:hypothetical protein